MSYLVKICGISEEKGLRAAVDAGADFVGFVHFPKSPRHVTLARAAELSGLLPDNIASVVVLVDPDDALLKDIATIVSPKYLQLHGKETPARVADIRTQYPNQKLIKAISVSHESDIVDAHHYESFVDVLMFDTKAPEGAALPGGNGISFNWNILKGFKKNLPWMLSGGLTAENIAEAIRTSGAKMVDVSSGVESQPGVKDTGKIQQFIKAAKA
jgi:phosphoribosylanthranilate isomerase